MTQVSGRVQNMTVSWFSKSRARSNQHCLYCGVPVGEGATVPSDKEHLIARNFVPTGSLGSVGFNFIFRACCECNGKKADFERHVSSVTLVNSPACASDEQADDSARRKAIKDFHPDKKGVLVGQSSDNHSVEFNRGGLQMKFSGTSPPQVNPYYTEQLASYHIQALFALASTEDYLVPEKIQLLPISQFRYFGHFVSHDWGNPHLLEITKRVDDWPCIVNVATVGGYFKAVLKMHEGVAFWALEWNRHLRVVGAIAHESESLELFEGLPDLGWKLLPGGSRGFRQTPLSHEAEDRLFSGKMMT